MHDPKPVYLRSRSSSSIVNNNNNHKVYVNQYEEDDDDFGTTCFRHCDDYDDADDESEEEEPSVFAQLHQEPFRISRPMLARTSSVGKLVNGFENIQKNGGSGGSRRVDFGGSCSSSGSSLTDGRVLTPTPGVAVQRKVGRFRGPTALHTPVKPTPPPIAAKPILRHTVRKKKTSKKQNKEIRS